MSDSPYAPPRSSVKDVERLLPSLERPTQMTSVILCVGLDYAVSVLSSLLSLVRESGGGQFVPIAIFTALGLLLEAWVNVSVAKGRRWARIVYMGFAALSLLGLYPSLKAFTDSGTGFSLLVAGLDVLSLGLELYVVYVLFTAAVRAWFREMHERGR